MFCARDENQHKYSITRSVDFFFTLHVVVFSLVSIAVLLLIDFFFFFFFFCWSFVFAFVSFFFFFFFLGGGYCIH